MTIGPATYNDFVIYQGGTLDEALSWVDGSGNSVDLDGYSAGMEIRAGEGNPPILALADGSGITLGTGSIRLRLDAARTASLPECEAVYDLRLTAGTGDSYYLLQGTINIQEMVTR